MPTSACSHIFTHGNVERRIRLSNGTRRQDPAHCIEEASECAVVVQIA